MIFKRNRQQEQKQINYMEQIQQTSMHVLQEAVDWIFPRRCPVCDDIVTMKGELICPECKEKLQYISEPRCCKCGKQLLDANAVYCYDCERKQHLFERGVALYDYHAISDSIYRFKYKDRPEYAAFYGKDLAKKLAQDILQWHPDALIPVPLHASKLRKRTYNQAELLAKELGKNLSIPVYTDLVKRVRKTRPQKELDVSARQKNLEKAFIMGRNDVKLKKTVIIDDIYTTGSTVDAIAAELLCAGVEKIYFVTLSIGKGV